MIDKKFFQKLKEEYISYSRERHGIIKSSSDVLRKAKQAIFAMHREDIKLAKELLDDIEATFKELSTKFKQNNKLQYEGAYQAALEEYVEAKLFYRFLENKKVVMIKEVKVRLDQYLGGLCDFTGELVRRAVKLATNKQYEEIKVYKEVTEEVIGQLIQFDLTKNLRNKYDQTKKNLKKLEEILYDVSLTERD